MTLDGYFFDVMMTFNDVRLRFDVFVRCEHHKCMRLSVLQSDLRAYSCTNIMMEKGKTATAFKIFFKQISVEKKNHSLTASC